MLNKMEFLLKQEFDRISHYDLMFYSEMSKDLYRLFGTRDEVSTRLALHQPDKVTEEEEKKEAVVVPAEEPQIQVDLNAPIDLTALLKKAKKSSKDKKKAKKGKKAPAKPAAAATPAATSAPAQSAEPEVV